MMYVSDGADMPCSANLVENDALRQCGYAGTVGIAPLSQCPDRLPMGRLHAGLPHYTARRRCWAASVNVAMSTLSPGRAECSYDTGEERGGGLRRQGYR